MFERNTTQNTPEKNTSCRNVSHMRKIRGKARRCHQGMYKGMQKRAVSHLANSLPYHSLTWLSMHSLCSMRKLHLYVTLSQARPRALPSDHVSGAENGAERAENGVSGNGAVSGTAGGHGSRAERRAGVTKIGLSVSSKSAAHAPLTCSVYRTVYERRYS